MATRMKLVSPIFDVVMYEVPPALMRSAKASVAVRSAPARTGTGAVKPRDGPTGRQMPVGSFDVSTVRQRSAPKSVKGGWPPSATERSGVYWLTQKPLRSGRAGAWA